MYFDLPVPIATGDKDFQESCIGENSKANKQDKKVVYSNFSIRGVFSNQVGKNEPIKLEEKDHATNLGSPSS